MYCLCTLTINWVSKTRHQNRYLYPRLFIEQLAMKYSRIKNYQVLHNIGIFSHFPVLQIRRKLSQRQHALHKSERYVFVRITCGLSFDVCLPHSSNVYLIFIPFFTKMHLAYYERDI